MEIDEDRKRIRCKKCDLPQFVSRTKACVKCKEPYGKAKASGVVVVAPPPPPPLPPIPEGTWIEDVPADPVPGKIRDLRFWMSFVLTTTRERRGLRQVDVARRLDVARTWMTKIEGDVCTPSVPGLLRWCAAVEVFPEHILRMTEFLVNGE